MTHWYAIGCLVIILFAVACMKTVDLGNGEPQPRSSDLGTGAGSADSDTLDTDTVLGSDTATVMNTGAETDTGPGTDCGDVIEILSEHISPHIATVGIVEWSVRSGAVTDAVIEFGSESGAYRWEAPVDLSAPRYRTLLLGNKANATYFYRIAATVDGMTCTSEERALETGGAITGLSPLDIVTEDPDHLAGGFIVSSIAMGNTAFILDEDGDYVWAYTTSVIEASRARMSADGKYMLVGTLNVGNSGTGRITRISMDGAEETIFSVPDRHHDFTVLPTGEIATIEFEEVAGQGTCDRIVELDLNGNRREVYRVRDDFTQSDATAPLFGDEWCHSNAINYVPAEDAYYLSILDMDCIIKVNRSSGELVWVFGGGPTSSFLGADWQRQHQHHVLPNGNLLIFNNGAVSGGPFGENPSYALEFALDEVSSRATLIWQYDNMARSNILGDVKRLPNGNTLVDYSDSGLIHEVYTDPGTGENTLIRSISWSASGGGGGAIGYANWRETLYGLPYEYR